MVATCWTNITELARSFERIAVVHRVIDVRPLSAAIRPLQREAITHAARRRTI